MKFTKEYRSEYRKRRYRMNLEENREKSRINCRRYVAKNRDGIALKQRNAYRLKQYGITPVTFHSMSLTQNGQCAICAKQFDDHWDTCVDHNHENGQIRQLLCRKCNFLIGNAKEDISVLLSAVNYLNKWR